MIKGIIFDYGGVLGSDADMWETAFKEIPAQTGMSVQQLDALWEQHWPRIRTGDDDMSRIWEGIIAQSRTPIDCARLQQLYFDGISQDPATFAIVHELRSQHYVLGVLANESRLGMEMKTRKFALHSLFDCVLGSADIRAAKPSRRAYEIALGTLGLQAHETIFVDNLKRNTDAYKEIGGDAIVYQDAAQLRTELLRRNILT